MPADYSWWAVEKVAMLILAVGTCCRIASAQEMMVAPEVMTSSTKRMCLPSNSSGWRTEKIPSTFSHLSCLRLRACEGLLVLRMRLPVLRGRESAVATPSAMYSAWL